MTDKLLYLQNAIMRRLSDLKKATIATKDQGIIDLVCDTKDSIEELFFDYYGEHQQ